MLHQTNVSPEHKTHEYFSNQCDIISEILSKDEETIAIGDINIDMSVVNAEDKDKTNIQKQQNSKMKTIKTKLIKNGLNIINKEHTFRRGQYE